MTRYSVDASPVEGFALHAGQGPRSAWNSRHVSSTCGALRSGSPVLVDEHACHDGRGRDR
jgi:hypothetical protein